MALHDEIAKLRELEIRTYATQYAVAKAHALSMCRGSLKVCWGSGKEGTESTK